MIRTTLALALIAGPATALELSLPVDCEIGARCYVQNYVDRDSGPNHADFTCGSLSYDGHKGTDFRVATFAEMEAGVDILAAAAGRVRATRDGVTDTGADDFPEGKDCGNAVVIDHDDGWTTQYCHLAKDSVAVRSGDLVDVGDRLGLMGFSGRTTFPHLHFTVRKHDEPVDPFGAQQMTASCDLSDEESLWSPPVQEQLDYRGGGIVELGLTHEPPTLAAIRAGYPGNIARSDGPAMILWARFYGLRKGDVLSFILMDPTGVVVSQDTQLMQRNRAEEFRYIGRKGVNWPRGDYRALVRIYRDGQSFHVARGRFEVP